MDTLIECGEPAPEVALPDLQGKLVRLSNLRGQVVVLYFWSADCPHVERCDLDLQPLAAQWGEQVLVLRIAPNANEPEELLRTVAAQRGLGPVLVDAGHVAADRYGAVTTPHLFVVDAEGALRYQGAYDDVNFRRRQPSRRYLLDTVEALLFGRQPEPDQTLAFGCTIVRFV